MYVTLTQIQDHFGIKMTGEFITDTLGVKPDASEKKAKFWLPEKVKDIARALVNHAAERGNAAIEAKSAPKASSTGPADNSDLFG